MEEIIIYKFQLETILDALKLTKRIYVDDKDTTESCYDRQVKQAYLYADNALKGKIDERVKYIGNK